MTSPAAHIHAEAPRGRLRADPWVWFSAAGGEGVPVGQAGQV
jgi:hypothetical protein